jgi:cell wall-associated NlpC family hydrolase
VSPEKQRKGKLLTIVLTYIGVLFIISLVISIKSMDSGEVKPAQVCAYARRFISDDSLAKMSASFDCSKFTQFVFHKFYVDIPRSSAQQFATYAVDKNKKKQGDLVFFSTDKKKIGLVGIYLGNNHFIYKPAAGEQAKIENINNEPWRERYQGSGSVIDKKADE